MLVDITDVVTHTNYGDHRLRGFCGARGQIFPSPIDFHRRPYNTLALPCERVIVSYARLELSKLLEHYFLHCLHVACIRLTHIVLSSLFASSS